MSNPTQKKPDPAHKAERGRHRKESEGRESAAEEAGSVPCLWSRGYLHKKDAKLLFGGARGRFYVGFTEFPSLMGFST